MDADRVAAAAAALAWSFLPPMANMASRVWKCVCCCCCCCGAAV